MPSGDLDTVLERLVGEDLIAFRDSNCRVGLLANNCPHRGASLFFGRNEEAGLRRVYHGWKFDASGACIDIPNEPAPSDLKNQNKAVSHSGAHARGDSRSYMCPRPADPPPPPPPG